MIWACARISARKTVPITPRAPTDVIGSHRAVAIAFPRLAKEKRSMRPSVRKLVAAGSAGGLDGNAIVHLNYGGRPDRRGRLQSGPDPRGVR